MTHCKCEIHKVVHVLDLMAHFMCKLEAMMADFSVVNANVGDLSAKVDAVIVKVDELKKQIADAAVVDQPAIDDVAAKLADLSAKLQAAVA
jgi:hypothetical protein